LTIQPQTYKQNIYKLMVTECMAVRMLPLILFFVLCELFIAYPRLANPRRAL